MDLMSRLRMTKKVKSNINGQNKDEAEINLGSYLPFYVLYFILMGLQAQFAQTALGLARRYHQLNIALKSSFPKSNAFHFLVYEMYLAFLKYTSTDCTFCIFCISISKTYSWTNE